MWIDQGWSIYQLEVQIWFWFSVVWPPTLYLSSSTLYSSSLWRNNTISFSKLNKTPPPPLTSQMCLKWMSALWSLWQIYGISFLCCKILCYELSQFSLPTKLPDITENTMSSHHEVKRKQHRWNVTSYRGMRFLL